MVAHGGERVDGQVLGLDESANLLLKTAAGKVRSLPHRQRRLIEPDAP